MPKPKRTDCEKIERYKRKIHDLEVKDRNNKRQRRALIISSDESDIEQGVSPIHKKSSVSREINGDESPENEIVCNPVMQTQDVEEQALTGSKSQPISEVIPIENPSPLDTVAVATIEESPLDPKLLAALGDSTSDTPEFGASIHDSLANIWSPVLKKGMIKENKDKLHKEYLIPVNCKLLQAPKLNAEISAAVAEVVRGRDKKYVAVQQQLGHGIAAVNRAMDVLLKSGNKVETLKYLSDGCRILSDLHNFFTKDRTKLITPSLDKNFLHVIHDAQRDDTLFGNMLGEKIKASKAIERQGHQIKKSVSTTTVNNTSTTNVRASTSQGNWSGPPRYSSNRGGARKQSEDESPASDKAPVHQFLSSTSTGAEQTTCACTSTITQATSRRMKRGRYLADLALKQTAKMPIETNYAQHNVFPRTLPLSNQILEILPQESQSSHEQMQLPDVQEQSLGLNDTNEICTSFVAEEVVETESPAIFEQQIFQWKEGEQPSVSVEACNEPTNTYDQPGLSITNGENNSSPERMSGPELYHDSGSEYVPSTRPTPNVSSADDSDSCLEMTCPDNEKKKRKAKGQGNSKEWKRCKNAVSRLKGEEYLGFKKNEDGKYRQNVKKPARQLENGCSGHSEGNCQRGPHQKFECTSLTEEVRKGIFFSFWSIGSWEARKTYVKTIVATTKPKYRRKPSEIDQLRNLTFKYNLKAKTEDGEVTYHVCKKMFCATLGIGQKTVRGWLQDGIDVNRGSNATFPENENSLIVENVHENLPTKSPIELGSSIALESLGKTATQFLLKLPKMESHYCRASSSKLYLEPIWDSYRAIYREFQNYCAQENKRSCSWRTFYKTIKTLNIEVYVPKKDQCNKCTMHKVGNLSEVEFEEHQKRKNEARNEKDIDKCLANSETNVRAYTVDLQAVLLSPRLNAAAMYYKTKLKVHNYTIYDMNGKDVYCFIWHEANGGLESEIFASIIVRFLKVEIEKYASTMKFIIWSDGCTYQNRNTKLSNALLELAVEANIIIEQKYLEVGHTQMEVDSVHSVIERKLGRQKEIFVPTDYYHVIKGARRSPAAYNVQDLSYQDFLQYNDLCYSSIRPGNKVGDPCVTDIRALQYDPHGVIKYKLNFSDQWTDMPRRPKKDNLRLPHPPLYESPCAIEQSKFVHLQELKPLIPADHHHFYDNLKHKNCTVSVEDCPHIIKTTNC